MSPRPKTASDAVILEAAARLLARLGPARLRLEDVAREVGLAPATLLLRFKTKKKLLLAVAEHGIAGMADYFREHRRQSPSPLCAITAVSQCVRDIADNPQQLANLLAFLQLSVEDQEFRQCAERHDAALEREMATLMAEAQAREEIVACCPDALARAIIAMVRGSLLTWNAVGSHTTPEAWVKANLEVLLAPYTTPLVGRNPARTLPPSPAEPAPRRAGTRRVRAAS
ncbi:MAG: TetR/AcrR family transcriptional regulator [Vicinamibacterales bacterium]